MARVFIGIGSNEGERLSNVSRAAQALAQLPQTRLAQMAPIYETEPVGGPPQGDFLNTVVELETSLEPRELLAYLQAVETQLGRAPSGARHFLGRQPSGRRHSLAGEDRAGSVAGKDGAGSVGRRPSDVKWGPRVIDLDILLYDERVMSEADLMIPHPLMHRRRFVLEPLADLAPALVHPVLKRTIGELLAQLAQPVA